MSSSTKPPLALVPVFADTNLALLRKIALNLWRQHPAKGALKTKRYRAALNEDFLIAVLMSSFNLMR
jgi:hypothetical protein